MKNQCEGCTVVESTGFDGKSFAAGVVTGAGIAAGVVAAKNLYDKHQFEKLAAEEDAESSDEEIPEEPKKSRKKTKDEDKTE